MAPSFDKVIESFEEVKYSCIKLGVFNVTKNVYWMLQWCADCCSPHYRFWRHNTHISYPWELVSAGNYYPKLTIRTHMDSQYEDYDLMQNMTIFYYHPAQQDVWFAMRRKMPSCQHLLFKERRINIQALRDDTNLQPFKDEARTVYLKAQSVPRSKHFSSRL